MPSLNRYLLEKVCYWAVLHTCLKGLETKMVQDFSCSWSAVRDHDQENPYHVSKVLVTGHFVIGLRLGHDDSNESLLKLVEKIIE